MPHHRRIALRTGERGTQKPIQVPPCLGSEIAAASDFVQSRHIRRQSFQNLLVRLVRSTKLNPAAQLKLSVGRLLVLARLLVINDPVINLRHRCHAPPHGFQYVGRAVFAHEEPYHRPPQNVQFHWIAGQPVRLLTLSQLQPVFQVPQKDISAGQFMKLFPADVSLVMKLLKREQGAA